MGLADAAGFSAAEAAEADVADTAFGSSRASSFCFTPDQLRSSNSPNQIIAITAIGMVTTKPDISCHGPVPAAEPNHLDTSTIVKTRKTFPRTANGRVIPKISAFFQNGRSEK